MKYVILIGLCGWLGYEIYVLVKTIIAKKKIKKILSKDTNSDIDNKDNLESKN